MQTKSKKKNKMKTKNIEKFVLIGICLICFTQFIDGVGFSPTTLNYNQEIGKEICLPVSIDSESETITVKDNWATNKDVEWKVSNFETSASEFNLNLNYPNQLSLDERNFEVCLSGNKVGEYHGVLLLTEEQNGNSIMQIGIWIKAIINEKQIEEEDAPVTGGSANTGGSGSTTTTKNISKNSTQTTAIKINEENKTEEKTELENNSNSKITGNAIQGDEGNSKKFLISAIVLVVLIFCFIKFKRRKNE